MAAAPTSNSPTWRDVITIALKDAGAVALGQQPSANDINEGFLRVCWLLDTWNVKRFAAYHLIDLAAPSRGQQYYTLGPGGDFALAGNFNSPDFSLDFNSQSFWRSVQIESAFARLVATGGAPADYALNRIPSYEDYGRIRLKTQTSFPTHYFYDPAMPVGKVYFWPIPLAAQFEMHILVRDQLVKPQNVSETVQLPPEYVPAIELSLAQWMRMSRKMPPDAQLNAMVKAALNAIKVNNTQIAELQMPAGLARGRRRYNIFSDEP